MLPKLRKLLRQLYLLFRSYILLASRRVAPAVAGDLNTLAVLYGTDKAVGRHGYTPYYARHLAARRRSVRCILEIGIGGTPYDDPWSGGNSLRMWRSYFPRATVYGMDIYEKRLDGEPRIHTICGDQSDSDFLAHITEKLPHLDLIIDDGSHVGPHIVSSFVTLFPLLAPGGFYVIEDLETAYRASFQGGPPGTPGTGIELVKSLLDDIHLGPRPVASVHVYPGIVFIEKAATAATPPSE
jgi:hypothetical protein